MATEIDKDHVSNVCKIGQGEACCSFLFVDGDGMQCAKGTEVEPVIHLRRSTGALLSMGDNCEGWNR